MEKRYIKENEMSRCVVKYTSTQNSGVEPKHLTRNAIGYVIRGEKFIHECDNIIRIKTGDVFFLGQGTHHIEDIPTPNGSFEQFIFYFTSQQMQQIVACLNDTSLTARGVNSPYDRLSLHSIAVATPSNILKNILDSANRHYELGGFLNDIESERLKFTEVVHTIFAFEDHSLKGKIIQSLDKVRANFERVIYGHLLDDVSVEQLAIECNRSLTSFKKEFKDIFGMPPHQWYLSQRLGYAKMLLRTTRDSVMSIGITCSFTNTSHFIKLFKRCFGATPAVFRASVQH